MPSPYTTGGFYHAPISKVLVGSSVISYFLATFPFHHLSHHFIYDMNRVLYFKEIWCLVISQTIFLEARDMLLGSLLFYNFRIFERRFGSRKFCSFLMATGLITTVLEVVLVYTCLRLKLNINVLPSGPFCLIFPLLIPHFHDVPRVAVAHLWNIPITGKSFTYILSLQLASGSVGSFIAAVCGVLAGLIYRSNLFQIQSFISIPQSVSKFFSSVFGRLLDTPPPRLIEVNQGATLEIQRLQHMEQLEQHLLWTQRDHQPRRRTAFSFGLPWLNRQLRQHRPEHNNGDDQGGASPGDSRVSEEQVSRLCEMGFDRERVLHALHTCNNDITTATTFLLRES